MEEPPNQPQPDDAVLGGQGALPFQGVVLGGLSGLKRRLTSPIPEERAAALQEALNHGQQGLNFVIRLLWDDEEMVRQAAHRLLAERQEPEVKRALERFATTYGKYADLKRLLAAACWREADQETKAAISRACGMGVGQLRPAQIAKCPCEDLLLIDELWKKYSKGRFCFSVQQRLWHRLQSTFWDKAEVWGLFADKVGWRLNLYVTEYWKPYDRLDFSIHAPVGHLPHLGDPFGIFSIEIISDRLRHCQILETDIT